MPVNFQRAGQSSSFPEGIEATGDGVILAGNNASTLLGDAISQDGGDFIALELDLECLSEHIGLEPSAGTERIVGFARFRVGNEPPGKLIELVRHPWTRRSAIDGARDAFRSAGFEVAICNDRPGRIVNRLIRPYLNAVLRRYDEGLATKEGLDQTMRMGLGYPEGPMALLERTGLDRHFDITNALYTALGDADFAPAPRARIAKTLASATREAA